MSSLDGSKTKQMEVKYALLCFISRHFSIIFILLSMLAITEIKLSYSTSDNSHLLLHRMNIAFTCLFRLDAENDWIYIIRDVSKILNYVPAENIFLHLSVVSDLENSSTMQNIIRSKNSLVSRRHVDIITTPFISFYITKIIRSKSNAKRSNSFHFLLCR